MLKMIKTKKKILLFVMLLIPLGLFLSVSASTLKVSQGTTLTPFNTSSTMTADGIAGEAAWTNATALVVTTGAGGSIPTTNVTLKAVYTSTDIYILATWSDTTFSISRDKFKWNGTEFVTISGSESEDRIAFMWEITNIVGFDTIGCQTKCHSGNAYVGTNEMGDIWHLKSARGMAATSATNSTPLTMSPDFEVTAGTINIRGVADDNVIDGSSRSGDYGTGPYSSNDNGLGAPIWIEKLPVDWLDAMYLTQAEITAGQAVNRSLITSQEDQWYIANYTALGAIVPKEVTSPGAGSRGDISTGATWADGTWTVEIKRDLNTGNTDDVAFNTAGGLYSFGISLMDNSGGDADHSVASVATLAFPAGAATTSIPGFELLFITGSIFGAIVIYIFYKKRRK